MRFSLFSFSGIIKSSLIISPCFSKIINVNWNISYARGNPDGLYNRRVIGVNGDWPIKALEGVVGDTIYLNATNYLDVPTSLHAHGLLFKTNKFSDGAFGINHCGIAPGDHYVYELELTETGTYWIHSHYKTQYSDGLRAPLIVYPKNYEEESFTDYVVTISDWYHKEATVLAEDLLSVNNPDGDEPTPDSAIINDGESKSYKFYVGTIHRIRLINTSTMAFFHFSIDGHQMKIVELDGTEVSRFPTESVRLAPGQRVSVSVYGKNSNTENYYMHIDMDPSSIDSTPSSLKLNYTAQVVYSDFVDFVKGGDRQWKNIDETQIIPIKEVLRRNPDETYIIKTDIQTMDDGTARGLMNGVTFVHPKTPTLHTALTTGNLAFKKRVYGPKSNVIITGHNKVIRIVIENAHEDAHPFHLHGHKFQILEIGSGEYDSSKGVRPGHSNPVRRDTVVVPPHGYVVIHYISDNPGVWPLHCHNNWHMMLGMMSVIVEAPEELQRNYGPITINDWRMCKTNGFAPRGNGGGKMALDMRFAPNSPSLTGKSTETHKKKIIHSEL
ncbi:hypothetical protein BB559_003016 [Furculomyces boomerangus]|uniref:Laccase n=1 Tax=Furculomyces boomerangus TaxID=61424 RepID=A0A2T9YPW1_9FUNG|nr:hypothetical protein BB559_003016 [Furculomyces boomerangus]